METTDIIEKISELEDELAELYKQYEANAVPCCNKECSFYREDYSLNCSWTTIVDEFDILPTNKFGGFWF